MTFEGQILKMSTEHTQPIKYYLNLSNDLIFMNELISKELNITHTGYECICCHNDDPIYRMGFCKKCFFESPYASETILKPELSKAHLGIEERNLEIEQKIQLQPHFVYLAFTGDIKVGVTRSGQIPTRWIDQGATFALPIAKTTNRYEAGLIEVELKQYLPDKTNWKKMLQNEEFNPENLFQTRNEIFPKIKEEYQHFLLEEEVFWKINYPYDDSPKHLSTVSLAKTKEFSGKLIGIKGQYLCFENGNVFNIRGHEGFVINLKIEKK